MSDLRTVSSEAGPASRRSDEIGDVADVRAAVLDWGASSRRSLPWRETRDPWGILVSEVMLQQTQVGRVLERWPRFMERFPTPQVCAQAPLADVLVEWQGLGYPRRARFLHLAADRVSEAGEFPSNLDDLLALPGVGPYTARAVLAFAYEYDAAVVDTNIARVLSRLAGRPLTARSAQALADHLLPPGQSWTWNQTLMDVGACHCRPEPDCGSCPLGSRCDWFGDRDAPDPAKLTAHVSKPQARFAGSDRQARGRLMAALTTGPVLSDRVPAVMDRPPATARRLVADLIADGLCTVAGDELILGDGAGRGKDASSGDGTRSEANSPIRSGTRRPRPRRSRGVRPGAR